MSCPKCKSKYKDRIKRKLFQKLIPSTKRYICLNCNIKYLKLNLFNSYHFF